jgi:hypothetical protein
VTPRLRFWLWAMDVLHWTERAVHRLWLAAVERAGACVEYDDVPASGSEHDPW